MPSQKQFGETCVQFVLEILTSCFIYDSIVDEKGIYNTLGSGEIAMKKLLLPLMLILALAISMPAHALSEGAAAPQSDASEDEIHVLPCASNMCDLREIEIRMDAHMAYIKDDDAAALSGYNRLGSTATEVVFERAGRGIEVPLGLRNDEGDWVALDWGLYKLHTKVGLLEDGLIFLGKQTTPAEAIAATDKYVYGDGDRSFELFADGEWLLPAMGALSDLYDRLTTFNFFGSDVSKFKSALRSALDVSDNSELVNLLLDGGKLNKVYGQLRDAGLDGSDWLDVLDAMGEIADPVANISKKLLDVKGFSIKGLSLDDQVKLYAFAESMIRASGAARDMVLYTFQPEGLDRLSSTVRINYGFAIKAAKDAYEYMSADDTEDYAGKILIDEATEITESTAKSYLSQLISPGVLPKLAASIAKYGNELVLPEVPKRAEYLNTLSHLSKLQDLTRELYDVYRESPDTAINAKYAAMMFVRLAQTALEIYAEEGFADLDAMGADETLEDAMLRLAELDDDDLLNPEVTYVEIHPRQLEELIDALDDPDNPASHDRVIQKIANRYAESVNSIYGETIMSIDDVAYVGVAGDGIDSWMSGQISGVINGDLMAGGNTDLDTTEWSPDFVNLRIDADITKTDRIARLFAAVIEAYYGAEANECFSPIRNTMLYGDFSPDEYNLTPILAVDLGESSGLDASIALYNDSATWKMECRYDNTYDNPEWGAHQAYGNEELLAIWNRYCSSNGTKSSVDYSTFPGEAVDPRVSQIEGITIGNYAQWILNLENYPNTADGLLQAYIEDVYLLDNDGTMAEIYALTRQPHTTTLLDSLLYRSAEPWYPGEDYIKENELYQFQIVASDGSGYEFLVSAGGESDAGDYVEAIITKRLSARQQEPNGGKGGAGPANTGEGTPAPENTPDAYDPELYLGSKVVCNCDEWISLREFPSSDSARLAKIPYGTQLDLWACTEEYALTSYDGMSGYVALKYLGNLIPIENSPLPGKKYAINPNKYGPGTRNPTLSPYHDNFLDDAPWYETAARKSDIPVYLYPDADSEVLTRVPDRAILQTCAFDDRFSYVRYNLYEGFILNDQLDGLWGRYLGGGDYLGELHIVNCENSVSLREFPNAQCRSLAKVPKGATVEVYSHNRDFYQCFYKGKEGYIKCEYVR